MNDADVAIVTVADARYLPAACCQLASVAENIGGVTNVQLFMVVCDVTGQDIENVNSFFARRRTSVEVIAPDFVDEISVLDAPWPRAAYLRLYFDRVFDERWKRIIYFDADTRVCSPLAPLINADLHGQPIGAVHDFILYVTGNIHRVRRKLFLAADAPYFQSGVMVFDWQKIIACNGLAEARRFIAEHPEACDEWPDQNTLNSTFENRWTPLDPRWNLHEIYLQYGQGRLQPKLKHFTSAKPWRSNRPRAWRKASTWYKALLADSAWPDFVEEQSFMQAAKADVIFTAKRYYPHFREAVSAVLPSFLARRLPNGRYLPWVPRSGQDVEDMALALIGEAEGRSPALRPPEAVLRHGTWLTT